MLARLGLPLSAAQAFQAIADEHEPGWSREAAERAASLARQGNDFEATWRRAMVAGEALVQRGESVPSELVHDRPGVLRAHFYNAVRTAPSRERVLALAPMAAELDRLGTPQQQTLSDYVQHVARLDFRRRAPLAVAYADLLQGKPIADLLAAAVAQETPSRDVFDIVMGAMVEQDVIANHRAWFRTAVAQSGDPWFATLLARAEADAAIQVGNWLEAEAILRKAEALCPPDVSYQCLTIKRRLGRLYMELHRVHESLTALQGAVRAARSTGEWGRYRPLLLDLADVERHHSATATARAYANELLLMADDCLYRGPTYNTLAGVALLDGDGASARSYLTQALVCERSDLVVANQLADIARLDPQPGDLAQLQDMLTNARNSGELTAAEQVLALEIEGRLVVERDHTAGIALLRKAIVEADRLPGEMIADKARSNAYAELAFAAAGAGDYTQALNVIAEGLELAPSPSCAVAMVAEDDRAVVVARGATGQDFGEYTRERRPTGGALHVPPRFVQGLEGCPRVRVMATAALQGQPRVLPADLAWSYVTTARSSIASAAPSKSHALIISNVTPPSYLQLEPLAIQPVTGGATTTLAGPAATPARVLAAMANATEILFHTHALMDVGISDASHLVLSPNADGHYALTTEAIRKIALHGQPIVVLEACHTARTVRHLSSAWSLPRAFVAVGARAVFAAATEIPDAESSQFFSEVLARVRAGVDPAVALRDQRLVMHSNPSSWVHDVVLFE